MHSLATVISPSVQLIIRVASNESDGVFYRVILSI